MNKTKQLYLDTPIWDITQPREYALAFVHFFTSPTVERDAIHWLDYLKCNRN
ncbi:hypothetical protein LCGC14_1863970 [marine sediment metagenome]|uniref:Uncharacterized protein n=1 Tax=marine sediment metagenome TaxID=412755 RepID=A0A0F9IL52_9ZZZZ